MFLESCISFLIALDIAILTNNILILSLVNLRNQVENDCEKAIEKAENDSEIDNKYTSDLEAEVMSDLEKVKLKIKFLGIFSIINIFLDFSIFVIIFLRFNYPELWIDWTITILTLSSIILFGVILCLFMAIYNFDPKEKIRKWKLRNKESIRGKEYIELTKIMKKMGLAGRKKAEEEFDIKNYTKEIEKVYKKVIKE